MAIIQKSGILVWIHAVFASGTDSWTIGIQPWIGGIFRVEYSVDLASLIEQNPELVNTLANLLSNGSNSQS